MHMPHQKFQSTTIKPRYSKGKISVFGINSVYPRTPWITAWWSAAFPGFGHMYLGKHLHGFILIIWELIVNNQANLNLGIALSFLGRFEEAKAQINPDWGLLYVSVYIYSIWDSYRCAVEINKSHTLSEVEDAPVAPSDVSFFDVVILDKKKPLLGFIWSFFTPGLGQLYGGSTIVGTFVLAWWIFVCYKATAVRAWFYSFLGDFHTATAILDWQWFLFLPSMYAFAIYQAYVSVTESNTLYDIEQIRFLRVRAANLKQEYVNENNNVQIIATFDHSPFVEMVIHDMEKLGVPPENIVALPLENIESQTHIIDTINRVDGRSILDGAMMGATIFAVLGAIYGFVLDWGPIIWGYMV
jgi:TM2 domain-containing membrane protein YozV